MWRDKLCFNDILCQVQKYYYSAFFMVTLEIKFKCVINDALKRSKDLAKVHYAAVMGNSWIDIRVENKKLI